MNLTRRLKAGRRELLRIAQLRYATAAPWIAATYPDFLCIGAPRAATTWLYAQLRGDPQVFLPKIKEVHFFDEPSGLDRQDGFGLEWQRPFYFDMANRGHWRWYALQFREGGRRLKGDITPVYSTLSPERVKLIGARLPGLKVIYILRNPIERAWSGLRKSLWYQKGKSRVHSGDAHWLERAIMHPEVLKRGHYREAIETWGSVIAPQNMLYLFYDDIAANEQRELAKVYGFLGLPAPERARQDAGAERVNSAPALEMPAEIRRRLTEYYRPQISYVERRFNRDLRHWVAEVAPLAAGGGAA